MGPLNQGRRAVETRYAARRLRSAGVQIGNSTTRRSYQMLVLIRDEYDNPAEVSLDNLLGRLVFYPDGGASAGGISSAVLLDSERARLHGRRRIGSSMRDRGERLRGTSLHHGSVRMVHVPNDPGRAARRCDLVGCSRAASGV